MPEASAPPSAILSWLRLLRIPNVFTAAADIVLGFALVQHGVVPVAPLAILIGASVSLYLAGMILNDVFDVAQDTKERPERPIPSGQIALKTARNVGFGLLMLGAALGAAAGYVPSALETAYPWRSAAVAGALAASIVLYDKVLKRTPVAPVFMGLCRFLNVLLGASVAAATAVSDRAEWLYFEQGQLIIAAGLGVFVIGITALARTEATESSRPALTTATSIMALGIVTLVLTPSFVRPLPQLTIKPDWIWTALVLMVLIPILRHNFNAIMDPQPGKVQMAVKWALMSIITYDAVATLWVAGPYVSLGVFLLIVPMLALGLWIYST